MARSLNKKYFGNRNVGTTGADDNAIGGQGVASVTITAEGTYTAGLPTAAFSVPDLPTGVRTTGVVHGHALSAATTSNGTGYTVGDVLTVVGGTKVAAATFPVAAIVTVTTPTIADGGALIDAIGGVGDRFEFTNANLTQSLIVEVTAASGGVASAVEVVQAGIWNGTGAAPATTAGFTRSAAFSGPTDNNGTGLILNLAWGVYSFGTVAVQGDYTVAPSNPVSFTGGSGTGAAATITYGVSGIVVTEKGSGYTSAADAAVTFSGGTAAGTSVLTTDSGNISTTTDTQGQNEATNQENAIVPYAKTTSGGTSKIGDIVRQVGARRFKVKTADGTAICTLKGSAVSAEGDMTITATDSAGGTYFVTKIGGRKATLTRGTGTQFATDSAVQWTFGSATEGVTVKIANA